MNNLKMTKEILAEIYDDSSFKAEVSNYINTLIDEELAKEIPDCDFIDECIEVLESIESGAYSTVIPLKRNNLANGRNRCRVLSILVACAILLTAGLGAVALNYTIEKKKEAEAPKTTATTSTTSTTRTTTASSATKTTVTTTTAVSDSDLTKLKLNFDKSFKDEYVIGEKLNLSGVSAIVIYSDGTQKAVSLNECQIIYDRNFASEEKYETVTVKYKGLSDSFKVRILRNPEIKNLTSIYSAFPDGYDFTTDDIKNIDLSMMEVYAIYSDNSEEKLGSADYLEKD